jgi:hypothetical protein
LRISSERIFLLQFETPNSVFGLRIWIFHWLKCSYCISQNKLQRLYSFLWQSKMWRDQMSGKFIKSNVPFTLLSSLYIP